MARKLVRSLVLFFWLKQNCCYYSLWNSLFYFFRTSSKVLFSAFSGIPSNLSRHLWQEMIPSLSSSCHNMEPLGLLIATVFTENKLFPSYLYAISLHLNMHLTPISVPFWRLYDSSLFELQLCRIQIIFVLSSGFKLLECCSNRKTMWWLVTGLIFHKWWIILNYVSNSLLWTCFFLLMEQLFCFPFLSKEVGILSRDWFRGWGFSWLSVWLFNPYIKMSGAQLQSCVWTSEEKVFEPVIW